MFTVACLALVLLPAMPLTDRDGDGVPDGIDCQPADARVWALPSDPANLRIQSSGPNGSFFFWQPPGAPGATSVAYDLLRADAPNGFGLARCIATGASYPQAAVQEAPPQPGSAYFYLARATNICGGDAGVDTHGVARTGWGCLALPNLRSHPVVGGSKLLLWGAGATPFPSEPVQLEVSTDGVTFEPAFRKTAPDFGSSSTMTLLDTEALPSGPLTVRAAVSHDAVVKTVQVDHLPRISCQGGGSGPTVTIDCSASVDPDGSIDHFVWAFGDGSGASTAGPIAMHSYASPGTYDLEVTACDDLHLCTTSPLLVLIDVSNPPTVQPRRHCGCEQMFVFAGGGNSGLTDWRRPNDNGTPDPSDDSDDPAPLGPDPVFVNMNFEVEAVLVPGSDPALCSEGQQVKSTSGAVGGTQYDKQACSAGRALATCEQDSDCDTLTCQGGSASGQPCVSNATYKACKAGGGNCTGNNDGVCTAYPLAGPARGNDDYRSEHDTGYKAHCPACGSPRWFDAPGQTTTKHADLGVDFKYEADFVATLSGDLGSCSCHFKVVIDWDGAGKTYKSGTGLTLINDAESHNCAAGR